MVRSTKVKHTSKVARSTRDPEATKTEILDAAVEEFARHGLANARIEAIAAHTDVTKVIIYSLLADPNLEFAFSIFLKLEVLPKAIYT